ncbi:unnamed protein product [Mytilus coruscus]|uniref:VLIG-type G domain-containing protein n=1 Tax=Mytilus coruscus TaxID=42192 RepID=A0A6J8BR47_MYTCO|nr:unnamed protein product [Mytilus coruscus]
MNICILSVDGQTRSTADITSEMRTAIAAMMKKNVEQSLYYRLSKCQLRVDEEDVVHRNARQNALRVFNDIPNDCLNVKETVVPLQGKTWASWSQKLKNVCKSSQYKTLQEVGLIKWEMNEDRKKQMKICENLGPLMKTFLSILLKSINSHENCTVFVLWLKNYLDQKSRSVLPGYLSQYKNDWQNLNANRDNKKESSIIKRCRKELEKSEYNLAEASFGFEHLCREMGQIFESIDQFSAGRCTRGVFVQLVPVSIEKSKYDYVLVIDTEGLRAPELANQKQSHDNELATFVIGLGDITIVNIKGENTAEMKDVLQIAVHAF